MKASPTLQLDQALADPGTDKRLDILRLVGECGSISEAARRAGVSYKAGWQAVDTLSNLAGTDLVERAVGGAGGGGARLTPAGHHLLQVAEALAQARREVLSRFGAARGDALQAAALPALALRTSLRNQLPCEVRAVRRAAGLVHVRMALAPRLDVVSRITQESAQLLGLEAGVRALALFKATAVSVAPLGAATDRAADNSLLGEVCRADDTDQGASGGERAEIALQLAGGTRVVGFAAQGVHLAPGDRVCASFDAAAVVIAVAPLAF